MNLVIITRQSRIKISTSSPDTELFLTSVKKEGEIVVRNGDKSLDLTDPDLSNHFFLPLNYQYRKKIALKYASILDKRCHGESIRHHISPIYVLHLGYVNINVK